MPTQKEMMQSAKAYIEAEQYNDARRILKKVDHPTAKAWIAKLDTIAPVPDRDVIIGRALLTDTGLLLLAMVLSAVVGALMESAGLLNDDTMRWLVFLGFTALYLLFIVAVYQRWQRSRS